MADTRDTTRRWLLLLKEVGDNLVAIDLERILFVVEIPEGIKEELIKKDGVQTLRVLSEHNIIQMENPYLLIELLDAIDKKYLKNLVQKFMDDSNKDLKRKIAESEQKQNELKMNALPRGICVIISNEIFASIHTKNGGTLNEEASDNCCSDRSLRNNNEHARPGTLADEKALEETFRSLGFDVRIEKNCTGSRMYSILKGISDEDHTKYDAFVCCILSHGYNRGGDDIVFGTDWKAELVTDLKSKLNGNMCISLSEKPKIFLVQACSNNDVVDLAEKVIFQAIESDDREGSRIPDSENNGKSGNLKTESNSSEIIPSPETDTESEHQNFDGPTSDGERSSAPVPDRNRDGAVLPSVANFLSYISAIPDSGQEESCFVSIICEVFKTYARNEDLLSMLNVVSKRISTKGHPIPRLTKNLMYYKVYF